MFTFACATPHLEKPRLSAYFYKQTLKWVLEVVLLSLNTEDMSETLEAKDRLSYGVEEGVYSQYKYLFFILLLRLRLQMK